MRRSSRLLLLLAVAAIAVPLLPFLACGARIDHAVAAWLDPLPAPPTLAALEVGVLAADLLLPVPSSMVATLGGAHLGFVVGTACAWLGMTLGAMAGWCLGRVSSRARLAQLDPADRARVEMRQRRYGPLAVVISRPVPLLAEAAALMAGATGMTCRDFLLASGGGNLAVAAVWSLAGVLGREADSVQWVLVASLVLPAALAWLGTRRGLQRTPREL